MLYLNTFLLNTNWSSFVANYVRTMKPTVFSDIHDHI